MGNTGSTTSWSLAPIDNDFELVILVCKDMEVWLKENLNVYSSSDQDGTNIHKLFQMINQAKERKIISSKTAEVMKKLGRWRNSLVHDSDVNSLSACGTSRQEFLSLYDQVKTELDHMHMQLYSAAQLVHCSRASSSGQESSSIGLLAAGVGVLALAGLAAGVAMSSNEEREKAKKRQNDRALAATATRWYDDESEDDQKCLQGYY